MRQASRKLLGVEAARGYIGLSRRACLSSPLSSSPLSGDRDGRMCALSPCRNRPTNLPVQVRQVALARSLRT